MSAYEEENLVVKRKGSVVWERGWSETSFGSRQNASGWAAAWTSESHGYARFEAGSSSEIMQYGLRCSFPRLQRVPSLHQSFVLFVRRQDSGERTVLYRVNSSQSLVIYGLRVTQDGHLAPKLKRRILFSSFCPGQQYSVVDSDRWEHRGFEDGEANRTSHA